MNTNLAEKIFRILITFAFVVSAVGIPAEQAHAYMGDKNIPPDLGIISYWNFDEGGGEVAADSADGNTGTLVNNPVWTQGKVGSALEFDGTSSYVQLPDSPNLKPTDALTLEFWMYPHEISVDKHIFGSHSTCNFHPWHIGLWYSNGIVFRINDHPALYASNVVSMPDIWYHVVATFDKNSGRKAYVNGAEVASDTYSSPTCGDTGDIFRIGGRFTTPDMYAFDGILDEVVFYNRAISAEEIQQHYQNGLNGRSYWDLAGVHSYTLHAVPSYPEVHGHDWLDNEDITLKIYDGGQEVYSETQAAGEFNTECGTPCFYLNGKFDLQPGQVVEFTQGITVKSVTVSEIQLGGYDVEANTLWGTALPFSMVSVRVNNVPEGIPPPSLEVMTNENGNWLADFDDAAWDLKIGDQGRAIQYKTPNSDDGTLAYWEVKSTFIEASTTGNWVNGRGWPKETVVDLSINGVYLSSATMAQAPWNPGDPNDIVAIFDLLGYQIQPGDVLEATGSGITKTLEISSVEVMVIDNANNLISGTGPNGVTLRVCVNTPGDCVIRDTQVVSGEWFVDFSGEIDIIPGSNGWVRETDNDLDFTQVDWGTPKPNIGARTFDNSVEGWNWPLGQTVTVSIYDPLDLINPSFTGHVTTTVDPVDPNITSWFFLDFAYEYDLKPGDLVVATDGVTVVQTVVTTLEIVDIDPDTDLITGVSDSSSDVFVLVCDEYGCSQPAVPVVDGHWSIDLTGDREIDYGTRVDVFQWDETGNGTVYVRTAGAVIEGMIYMPAEPSSTSAIKVFSLIPAAVLNQLPPPPPPGMAPAAGSMVEACSAATCAIGISDRGGKYRIEGLPNGSYNLRGFPRGNEMPCITGPVTISARSTVRASDCNLDKQPPAPRPGSSVTPQRAGAGPAPTVFNSNPLELKTTGCEDGTASYKITILEDGFVKTGSMVASDDKPGEYQAQIESLSPHHGSAKVEYSITCPDGSTEEDTFFIYVDPSGTVKSISGEPISDATVTLLRSEFPNGPFEVVPDGSNLMSPSNRRNPDVTDTDGKFGWDVISGYYIVRADKENCTAVESSVMTIPPPVTDLDLRMNCAPTANAGSDQTAFIGDTITLSASDASDPDNNILTYAWDLDNDGLYDDATGMIIHASFSQIGEHVIGLQVTDVGGLSDTDIVVVVVSPWTLKGFYQPVDMNDVYNLVKGGSTVPLKFEIFAGSTEITDITAIKNLTYSETACDLNAVTDEVELTATGSTSLRYAGGQFIYNWKTPKTPGKCYRVTMMTMDGSSLMAYFKLK